MATPQQIEANRQNAQHSTGPVSPEGKQRSSQNATRHGFTGQNLIVSPAEKEAYENHTIAYLEKYSPAGQEETSLVQQCADLDWSLHQIFVQQSNLLTVINEVTAELMAARDFQAIAPATAPLCKILATYSTYEMRKRRAAVAVMAKLTELQNARREALAKAAAVYKVHKANNKSFNPADFGFVHSLPEIERFVARESAASAAKIVVPV